MYSGRVPKWMKQVATLPGKWGGAAASDLCDGHALTKAVYGAVHRDSGLTAFAYLWRRFGPPWWGSDSHKELVTYYLGTPVCDVVLGMHLSGSRLGLNVGYLITHDRENRARNTKAIGAWEEQFEGWWIRMKLDEESRAFLHSNPADDDPQLKEISGQFWDARYDHEVVEEAEAFVGPFPGRVRQASVYISHAITAALEELLRPVYIRDVPVTILGCLDERSPCWHPGNAHYAEPSRYAGYGVPQEAMDRELEETEPEA